MALRRNLKISTIYLEICVSTHFTADGSGLRHAWILLSVVNHALLYRLLRVIVCFMLAVALLFA